MSAFQSIKSDISVSSFGSDYLGLGGNQEEVEKIIEQIKADQQYFYINFEQFKDEINKEETPLYDLANNIAVDRAIIRRLVIREENYEKWTNVAEFLLERNKSLISTLEVSSKQLARTKENYSRLTEEVEYLDDLLKRNDKKTEDMQEYVREYEEKITELESDLRDKQDIINQFHQAPNFARLLDFSCEDNIGLPDDPIFETFDLDCDPNELDYSQNEYDRFSLYCAGQEYNHKLVDLLKKHKKENEELRQSMDHTTEELNSFQEKEKEDKERIEDLEKDIEILKTHVVVLEKEKMNSEKKYKNLHYKIQGFKNEVKIYRDNCEDLDQANTILERNCSALNREIDILRTQIKNIEYLNRKYEDQNLNLDLSKLSFNFSTKQISPSNVRRKSKRRHLTKSQPRSKQPTQKENNLNTHRRSVSQNSHLPSRSSNLNFEPGSPEKQNGYLTGRKRLKRYNSRDHINKWYAFSSGRKSVAVEEPGCDLLHKKNNVVRENSANPNFLQRSSDIENPLFTNNKSLEDRQDSDLSALNIDESQFIKEEGTCRDVMEANDSLFSKSNLTLIRTNSLMSQNNNESPKNISGTVAESDLSLFRNSRGKALYLEGIETILEANENSSSINNFSRENSRNFTKAISRGELLNSDRIKESSIIDEKLSKEESICSSSEEDSRFAHLEERKDPIFLKHKPQPKFSLNILRPVDPKDDSTIDLNPRGGSSYSKNSESRYFKDEIGSLFCDPFETSPSNRSIEPPKNLLVRQSFSTKEIDKKLPKPNLLCVPNTARNESPLKSPNRQTLPHPARKTLLSNAEKMFNKVAKGYFRQDQCRDPRIFNSSRRKLTDQLSHKRGSLFANNALKSESSFSDVSAPKNTLKSVLMRNKVIGNKPCVQCKDRKEPIEEFFNILVISLKLVHKEKNLILDYPVRKIYQKALKKNIQFYEFSSFIDKFLDALALKINYKRYQKLQAQKIKKRKLRKVLMMNKDYLCIYPKVRVLGSPRDFEIIDGFFLK
ncbi:unnamed protein product [Moneuplotes crassus]|uniref:Uncharacterized protein n=1 Tax=Euplotes crassus TaxID=5936 RepID=A0AAD2CX77_EUPCR|nr:unnamed protein product [Moneuplotes crassus]